MTQTDNEQPIEYNGQQTTVGQLKQRCKMLESLMSEVHKLARQHVVTDNSLSSDHCFDADSEHNGKSDDLTILGNLIDKWDEQTQTLRTKKHKTRKNAKKLKQQIRKYEETINNLQLTSYTQDRSIGLLKTQLAQVSMEEYNKACNMLIEMNCENDQSNPNQMHCMSYVVNEQQLVNGDGGTLCPQPQTSEDYVLLTSTQFGVTDDNLLEHIP